MTAQVGLSAGDDMDDELYLISMAAEVLGMQKVIDVKDEDGLYTKDPKRHDDAKLIPKIELPELLASMPEEMILDKVLFDVWKTARHVKELQIVNGLVPGQLTRALAGEPVGTIITKGGA